MYVPAATSALFGWWSGSVSIHFQINGAHEPHITNLPSRVMEPEAIELSRITFACPSWWLSIMCGNERIGNKKSALIGRNATWTVLVPLHKAG